MTLVDKDSFRALRIPWILAISSAVAMPIIAFSFRADERFAFYTDTARYGANPLRIVGGAFGEVPFFIGRGNFRPIGRMLDYAEHSFSFEVAVATGASLPLVHGLFRLLAIFCIGTVGALSLRYLQKSIEDRSGRTAGVMATALVLYPMVFGGSVVAAGTDSPYTLFPFLYLMTTALALGAPLLVARDANLQGGSLRLGPAVAYVLLGGALAGTFDLVYLAMPLIVVFAVIRLNLGGYRIRDVMRMRLGKAIAATSVGFLATFIPTRLLIQRACEGGACYAASDLSFDVSGVGVFLDRSVTGFPPAGWSFVQGTTGVGDPGWRLFLGNAGATVAGLILVVAAIAIVRRIIRLRVKSESRGSEQRDDAQLEQRQLVIVSAWPVAIIALAASLAAVSANMQSRNIAIGYGWRDSGFATVGWALAMSVALATVVEIVRRRKGFATVLTIIVVVLVASTAKTFLVNANLAESAASDPEAIVNNRIAAEAVDFDLTELGNERRCSLVADFSRVYNDRHYQRDSQLAVALELMSQKRYGLPFCDYDVLATVE